MKYEAESTFADARPNKQASDFYISFYDTTKDKCYLVPVSQTYQMQQTIKDFEKDYVTVKDREYEDKTYFEMKQIIAKSLGTAKARRKLESLEQNKVEDTEGGVKSKTLRKQAKNTQNDIEELRKNALSASARRAGLYSKEALMPAHIFADIPYSETYKALKNEKAEEGEEGPDKDRLKELICPFAVSIATRLYDKYIVNLDSKEGKTEKKQLLRAIVYLDALMSMQRMKNTFSYTMDELSSKFHDLPKEPLGRILEKFT